MKMKNILELAILLTLLCVLNEAYIVLEVCPIGCECFERNTRVECREARLKEIPVLKFAGNVKRLVLKGNKIQSIDQERLKEYGNLEYLDVSGNELSVLSDKIFMQNPHLKEVNVGLNPFRCDCDLRGFIENLRALQEKRMLKLEEAELAKCAAPQTFNGKPLLGISFQDKKGNTEDETMYIGEDDDRGIAICIPSKEVKMQPKEKNEMMQAEALQQPTAKVTVLTLSARVEGKGKKSVNAALITASVLASVLVTFVAVGNAVRYLRQDNRWKNYRDNFMDFVKKKPLKKDPSTFEAIIKKQRRASCGYAPSDCSSDEEPGTEQKKKQKYGYTAVPTTEPAKMEDIALTSD